MDSDNREAGISKKFRVKLLTDQSGNEDNRREVPEYNPEKPNILEMIFNEYNPNMSISLSVLTG